LAPDLVRRATDPLHADLLNVAATDIVMTTDDIPNRSIYGAVVCTGLSADGTITPLPAEWAQRIASHRAIRPIDAA
jgi:hypothetical protein